MEWSPQQVAALNAVDAWMADKNGKQVFRLDGYAGTGKTTIARDIYNKYRSVCCAYTGKAASVLISKGLGNSSTLHRLIYTPLGSDKTKLDELKKELELLERVTSPSKGLLMRTEAVRRAVREAEAAASKPQFILKEESELSNYDLVIADERSMIGQRHGEDLASFGVKMLLLGDPAQLDPVGDTGYMMDGEQEFLLTEIHRQAQGNPIIDLATRAREGRSLILGDYGKAKVVPWGSISAEEATSNDMVLCGTNKLRQAINMRHRKLEGHSLAMPEAGERLVCLKNNHDLGLLNGTLWNVTEDSNAHWETGEDSVHLRIEPDTGGAEMGINAESVMFINEDDKPRFPRYEMFTWGSALTVHKSQGSQWDKVLMFDDWTRMENHRNWLYTGITRAADELTVVKPRR